MTKARLLLLGLLAVPAAARADYIPPCAPPKDVIVVPLPSGLPSAIAGDITGGRPIALPGEKFDSTDIGVTGISLRYIFAWKTAGGWIVAVEHGGIGYNDPIFRYAPDGGGFRRVQLKISFPQLVCRDAAAMADAR